MSDDVITDKLPMQPPSSPTPASSTASASAAVNGQLIETSATTVKPGYLTTEFYLALAAKLLGAAFAVGFLGDGSTLSRLGGMLAIVLTQLGYTVSRTVIKTAGVFLFVAVLGHAQMACKTNGPVISSSVIDCTMEHTGEIASLFLDLKQALSGGSWSDVYQRAKAAGTDIGGCALAELVQDYLGGKAAPAKGEGQTARATLEKFRAEEAGGATFKTAAGAL